MGLTGFLSINEHRSHAPFYAALFFDVLLLMRNCNYYKHDEYVRLQCLAVFWNFSCFRPVKKLPFFRTL